MKATKQAVKEYKKGLADYSIITTSETPEKLGLKEGLRYPVVFTSGVNVTLIDIPNNNIPGNKDGVMLFNASAELNGRKVNVGLTHDEALKFGLADEEAEMPNEGFVTVQSYTKKSGEVKSYIAFTENTALPIGEIGEPVSAESAESAESVK